MSNTFDFNRFKKVLARDFHATYSRFGLAILIIVLLSIVAWIWGWVSISKFADIDLADESGFYMIMCNYRRARYFILGVFVAVAIAPGIIYKSCNMKGRGNYFALLPASVKEKYLSMFLYCSIVVPVVVIFGGLLLDTLLTLLPFGPYKVYFWQCYKCYNNWFSDDELIWAIWIPIALLLLTSAVFMFTNTIFKRAKFIKTMLWLMLVGFVLMIVLLLTENCLYKWLSNFIFDENTIIIVIFVVFPLILAAVLQFFTYRRLKKMQY